MYLFLNIGNTLIYKQILAYNNNVKNFDLKKCILVFIFVLFSINIPNTFFCKDMYLTGTIVFSLNSHLLHFLPLLLLKYNCSILALLRLGAPILSLSIYHSLSLSVQRRQFRLSLSPADNKHAYNTARSESFSDPTRLFRQAALTAWITCRFGA